MNDTDNTSSHWNEDSSERFLELGDLFVPRRTEQLAVILDLLPAQSNESFTVVELGAGGGVLAQAILEKFPRCHYVAFDGSEVMRQHLAHRLSVFQDRVKILPFELTELTWYDRLPSSFRCLLSSLCVHHLTSEQKQRFFVDMVGRLDDEGVFLLADIINPASQRIADLFARQYDEIVREQSIILRGDLTGYEQFCEMRWNYFRYDYGSADPDPIDFPSSLSDQLRWLSDAGLLSVDCFWMQAGHAIYGGYKG